MKKENELAGRMGQWSEWEMSEAKAKNRIPIDFTFSSGKSKSVFDRDLLKDLKKSKPTIEKTNESRIAVREILQLKEDMLEKQIPFANYLLLDSKIMKALE